MKQVFKYPIELIDRNLIQMPKGAQVLCVQTQNEGSQLWALVDPMEKRETRCFRVYGTGHEIVDTLNLVYVGTFQMNQGTLVFHLFEEQL